MSPAAFLAGDSATRAIDLDAIDHATLAAAIFHETNRVRAAHDLKPLAHAPALDEAAAMHARDMVAGDFFAHENPTDPAKRTPLDRVRLSGYVPRYVAENLATTFATQYEPGRPYYRVPGGASYTPDGPPLPMHTYASLARTVLQQWMNSPHHRENLMATQPTQLGTAARLQPRKPDDTMAKFDCVQEFGDPMPRRGG